MEELAVEMLKALRPFYEKHRGITVSNEVLEVAVKESSHRVRDRHLPDKAVDVLDEACAAASAAGESAVTGAHAKAVVDAWAPQAEDGVHRGGGSTGGSAGAFPKPARSGAADSTGEGERTERGAAAANKLLEAMHQLLERSSRSKP